MDKDLSAISWAIATQPKLYRELSLNPYTSHTKHLISKMFPQNSFVDVVHAIILAEPEGRYDITLEKLGETPKSIELMHQTDVTSETNARLINYCKNHAVKLKELQNDLLYESLFSIVFETNDVQKTEQNYSQTQRRDFKLSIISFIENRDKKNPVKLQKTKAFFTILSILLFLFTLQKLNQSRIQHQTVNQVLGSKILTTNQIFPVRLIIPSVNVDAAVQEVDVAANGEMDAPKNTFNVGWFGLGPVPGDKGSAVIDGHFDGQVGQTGVFNNLDQLKAGDKIHVVNNFGKTVTFTVRESRVYDPGYVSEVFSPNDNGTHLNLITCDGIWNGAKKSYTKRLVIFSDLTINVTN